MKLSFLILLASLIFCFPSRIVSQEPKKQVYSPQEIRQTEGMKSALMDSPYNLERFFKMDDTREASVALRNHVYENQLPLDETTKLYNDKKRQISKGSSLKSNFLIHLPNEEEFIPEPGVENELQMKSFDSQKGLEDTSDVVIIQFNDGITIRNSLELLDLDVKVYDQIGDNTFIARIPSQNLKVLSEKLFIRWIGSYKPEYKYSFNISQSLKPGVFIYPLGGDKPKYWEDLKQLGISIRGYDKSAMFYNALADNSQIELIAKLWWVKGIVREPEEVLESLIYQVKASDVTVNFEPYDSRKLIMADQTNLTGLGVTVGVRDNGIDKNHPQLLNIFHSESENTGVEAHGTHVVGIIAGRNKSIEGPWGLTNIQGIAPETNILFRENDLVALGSLGYSNDFSKFIEYSSKITSHSYMFREWFGLGEPSLVYDGNTTNFDAYCDNDDLLIVKSAGNQFNQQTITNPGTGKNVIAVGAINYATRSGYELGERSDYSSQGPTLEDSRLKPELVAPGGDLDGVGGVVSANSNWNGIYDPLEWETDNDYLRMSGTSMAAPHVAGVLAKIKQWKNDISSTLAKALLINTTIPIKANSNDPFSGYANTQVGYGLVNAFSITHLYTGESNRLLFACGTVTEDALYDDWTINVTSGAKKLLVTLAYNDQEGDESNDDALKDDLDLVLISPSGESYFAFAYKPTGVINESPLEKMVITNPEAGVWTVQINFTDSPGFDNPFVFSIQDYSVVAHEIYKEPSLTMSNLQPEINVNVGQDFVLEPTITNTGGYLALGITVRVTKIFGSGTFEGDIDKSHYIGNLLYQYASLSPQIKLKAPITAGVYQLLIETDGINKEFDNSTYPKVFVVTVNVTNPSFSISGYVRNSGGSAISGVTMVGLPGSPITNSIGYYSATVSYGWNGTVTPSLTGYTFTPASSSYSNVTSNRSADYTGAQLSYTISGYVRTSGGTAISGVTMVGLPGSPITNSSGYYSATVSYGWSGTVTPTMAGYSFTPVSSSYSNVTSNRSTDYIGTIQSYSISGYVRTAEGTAISGVTMGGLPGSTITNSSGYYSSTVSYGWSGIVTPSLVGFIFVPASSNYSNVTSNQSTGYIGTPLNYTISGYVRTSGGAAISGVMMDGLPDSPITNASGYYSAIVGYGWSGTVKPVLTRYGFDPETTVYSNLHSDQTTDYTGTLLNVTISGYVRTPEGLPISNVVLNGLPGNPMSNFNGYYIATMLNSWSGTVTPSLTGYSIEPINTIYNNISTDQTADYTGTIISDFVSDVDGNNYIILKIGTQDWFASDLMTTKYNDGTEIPLISTGTTWSFLTTAAYCSMGGIIYNWYAVNNGNLCPAGWRVPTDADWTILSDYLGGTTVAGGKLKSTATDVGFSEGWRYPNEGASNESGFSSLPRIWRLYDGSFEGESQQSAHYWSSSEAIDERIWYRSLLYNSAELFVGTHHKSTGFSVRCLKDNTFEQSISLANGWNLLSMAVTPPDISMQAIVDPLISSNMLVKVQNETGRALEMLTGTAGWINEIGQINPTEGYKVRVNGNTILELTGQPISMPLDILLESGWNIIGYPSMNPQSASSVFGALISSGALIKVQNELGQAIEQIDETWNYGFSNIIPGEGYKVKTSTGDTLTITGGAKGEVFAEEKVKRETEHFRPGYVGNGLDHMNIYIGMGEWEKGRMGDEIGVFDGDLCVGAAVIEGSEGKYITVAASFDDPVTGEKDGFEEGNRLEVRIWSRSEGSEVILTEVEPANGYGMLFERQGTTVLKAKIPGEAVSWLGDAYPNPSRDKTTFTFGLAGESRVKLEIIDIVGNTVDIILDETMPGVIHRVEWDNTTATGNKAKKGIYFYKLSVNGLINIKQLVIN